MIEDKKFYSKETMNEFINESKVKVVSIETKSEKYDTGLPLMNGTTFESTREYYKLWFEKQEETKIQF